MPRKFTYFEESNIRLERKRQIRATILFSTNKYLRVHFKSYLLLINDINMPNYYFLPKLRRERRKTHTYGYYEGLNLGSLGSTPKALANPTNTQLIHA